jgi:hypothetical protein
LCSQEFEQSYDSELKVLHVVVQEKVVKVLSDHDNAVKMMLVTSGLGQLCHFFGKNKGGYFDQRSTINDQ